ncbi:putative Leucine carboxyl methyltransferase 1 [Glarea lozoyensis 74030]|uniref:Putative Leucine carboxyl methyltransferase 1 n=1 Tax=Glarea lozoyensis (strain ATCC 74030 / MF5533) TaxID=1104152 RepID=H0EEP7_GLAL7|nr:putative Leucine carboxyl methyltransferase 1 [Glarea lozoyensis 74030]
MPTVEVYKNLADQKERISAVLGKNDDDNGSSEAQTIERIWEQWVMPEEKERVDSLEGLDEIEEERSEHDPDF